MNFRFYLIYQMKLFSTGKIWWKKLFSTIIHRKLPNFLELARGNLFVLARTLRQFINCHFVNRQLVSPVHNATNHKLSIQYVNPNLTDYPKDLVTIFATNLLLTCNMLTYPLTDLVTNLVTYLVLSYLCTFLRIDGSWVDGLRNVSLRIDVVS